MKHKMSILFYAKSAKVAKNTATPLKSFQKVGTISQEDNSFLEILLI